DAARFCQPWQLQRVPKNASIPTVGATAPPGNLEAGYERDIGIIINLLHCQDNNIVKILAWGLKIRFSKRLTSIHSNCRLKSSRRRCLAAESSTHSPAILRTDEERGKYNIPTKLNDSSPLAVMSTGN